MFTDTAKAEATAHNLGRTVRLWMAEPEHRAEFESWYLKTYGKEYVWQTVGGKR